MIIFKTEDHPGAWDINGVKILCESYVENWDYEIKGKYGEGLELLKICIRTIFVNPDKKYLLKFGEATVYPSDYKLKNSVYMKIIRLYHFVCMVIILCILKGQSKIWNNIRKHIQIVNVIFT